MVKNDVIRTAAGDLESNRSSSRTRWGIRIISVIGYVTHNDIVGSDEYDFAALIRTAENNSTNQRSGLQSLYMDCESLIATAG